MTCCNCGHEAEKHYKKWGDCLIPCKCKAFISHPEEHTTLTARVAELEQESAKLLDEVEARRFTDERTDKLLDELEAENKRLREALGFYADPSKWRCSICVHEQEHVDGICLRDCFSEPLYGGDVARNALANKAG